MPAHWQRVVKYPPLCTAGGSFWSRSVETTISNRFIFIWRQVDKKDKLKLYLTRNVDVWWFKLEDHVIESENFQMMVSCIIRSCFCTIWKEKKHRLSEYIDLEGFQQLKGRKDQKEMNFVVRNNQ